MLFVSAVSCALHAVTWYVDSAAVVSGDGKSPAAAFRTIGEAAAIVSAGDTCFLRKGTYYEALRPANSGAVSSPIVFAAYPGETPVIHGGARVGQWSDAGAPVYTSPVSDPVRWVFVDRRYMTLARHPNLPYHPSSGFDMLHPVLGTAAPPASVDWTGVVCIKDDGRQWTNSIVRQDSYQETVDGAFLGVDGLLDSEGEWCLDNGILSLWPPGGKDPSGALVEISTRRFAVDFSSRTSIVLYGVTLFGASINLDSSQQCLVDSCTILYVCPLFLTNQRGGWTRWDGAWLDAPGVGIALGGSHSEIRSCEVAHSWGDGITVYGTDNTVFNSHVYDCDWSGTDCAPITTMGRGHTIDHCTLHHAGRCVLLHRSTSASFITHNDMFAAGLLKGDLGVTYTYGTDGAGAEVAYNWVHDNVAGDYGGAGIYLDNRCSNFLVHHNVIWNISTGRLASALGYNTPNNDNLILNNTVFNSANDISEPGDWSGSRFVNNIFQSQIPRVSGAVYENNLEGAAAQFADPEGGDFRPASGSPCIDAGKTVSPHTDGFVGAAPDIGACESAAPLWVPGASFARYAWKKPRPPRVCSRVEAERLDAAKGVFKTPDALGGCDSGDWAMYAGIDFGTGQVCCLARVGCENSAEGGNVQFRLDSLEGACIGTMTVAGTGGYSHRADQTCSISNAGGVHDLFVVFTSDSTGEFDYFSFAAHEIEPASNPRSRAAPPRPRLCRRQNGLLLERLCPGELAVLLVDARGRALLRFNTRISAGKFFIALDDIAEGFYLLSVGNAGVRRVWRVGRVGN